MSDDGTAETVGQSPEGGIPVDSPAQPEPEVVQHRYVPISAAFRQFIASGWTPRPDREPAPLAAAWYTGERRRAVAAALPGERLVLPSGELRVRSNDSDYRFRPHSAFAHLTGLGAEAEPNSVLVLEPSDAQPSATLFFRPRAERDSEEF